MLNRKLLAVAILVMSLVSCTSKEENQIYICGRTNWDAPFYWANGEMVILEDKGGVDDMVIVDGDIYCSGYIDRYDEEERYIAMIWKNGVPYEISTEGKSASADCIEVIDQKFMSVATLKMVIFHDMEKPVLLNFGHSKGLVYLQKSFL